MTLDIKGLRPAKPIPAHPGRDRTPAETVRASETREGYRGHSIKGGRGMDEWPRINPFCQMRP